MLRSLFRRFAARRVRARDGDDAAGSLAWPGRVDRRRLLTLIGVAPIVGPAVAKAVIETASAPRIMLLRGASMGKSEMLTAAIFEPLRPGHCIPLVDTGVLQAAATKAGRLMDSRLAIDSTDLRPAVLGGMGPRTLPRLVTLPGDAAFLVIDDVGSGP